MTRTETTSDDHHILAIVGSGFAGVGAAIRLTHHHQGSVVIFERAESLGGVWRDNTYPGAACDVQSVLYSFSFAPSAKWRNTFARQSEIRAYLERVARDHGLLPRLRTRCAVDSITWDTARSRWVLETERGTSTADHVVLATGALADPAIPDIADLDKFEGPVFHSAEWDHSVDLTNRRVAVVGTGASAIQFVPQIQPLVSSLTLFQRTPPWVMPRNDAPISRRIRTATRRIPGVQKLRRAKVYALREVKLAAFRHPRLMAIGEKEGREHLAHAVSDPALRAKLTPDYRMGCKRILISDSYYPALAQPNVDVQTTGIDRATAHGLVDTAGVTHEVDAIIFGTGFHTSRLPLTDAVTGPQGYTLSEDWGESPRAYMGTSVAGFPNLYLMHGPNIGLGHTSVIMMFESQLRYIDAAMRLSAERDAATVEPTDAAQRDFAREVDGLTDGTVWTSGGCTSWYLDPTGRNSNLWPSGVVGYRRRATAFRSEDHLTRTAGGQP
ncbi:flavin-containing monooxygenase [Williamsia maris]|uniref:Flavoprotein CzcO associated with the cation diffusion facilitator CzcD n=1 Tax=Williamsia maris TaxID=72806 RepID=A0ABT1H9U9_9NOCA|nr:NAD(P)/FAD-dependent oxidoreductase [Williamsia maris]MCP2175032.1 putative flavoprotein CzcO associated with the cation diffusion facilitator CzcD [Williamsia maris]